MSLQGVCRNTPRWNDNSSKVTEVTYSPLTTLSNSLEANQTNGKDA